MSGHVLTARCVLAWTSLLFTLATHSGCGSLIVTQKSVASLEDRRGFTWEKHESDGFVFYVESGSADAAYLETMAADAHAAREAISVYLREPLYEPTVAIFVPNDRDRMKDLVGRAANATAYHTSNALCVVRRERLRTVITHELTHVVAMNVWGVPERWINEGVAMDVDAQFRARDLNGWSRTLRDNGELLSLIEFTARFNRHPGAVTYPAAGSFVRHLRETYGLDTVRAVWDGGRAALPTATGTSLTTLESSWLEIVDAAEPVEIDAFPKATSID